MIFPWKIGNFAVKILKAMRDFKPKGHIAMLGANVMWGLMSPVAKLLMATGVVTPFLLTGFRIFGAAALFWLTSLFARPEHVPSRDLMLLAGAAMLGILFNQGCFIFGVGLTSPGEASIITTTMPMWVMVLAAVILREPITWLKAGGVIVGASGALMLVLVGTGVGMKGDNPMLGDMLVLFAQLSYALYLTLYKRFIAKYSLVTMMKWMFLFASIALLPFSVDTIATTDWTSLTRLHYVGILYVVGFSTYLAYACVMVGQKNLRPTLVGIYNYVQPVVASIVGVCLGLDRFTPLKMLAVALIFGGVFLVTRSKARTQGGQA